MTKPTLILIGADKGGVGKTMVARAMTSYLRVNSVAFHSFDTEYAAGGVLKRFCPDAVLVDVATVPGQMMIFDSINDQSVTVVDIRAGQLSPTLTALANSGVMNDMRKGNVRLLVLHVLGSTVASTKEVADLMKQLQGAEHVLVRNHSNPDSTFPGIEGKALDVPYLNETACEAVDTTDAPFVQFALHGASRTLRGYVQTWFAAVMKQFDTLGLMGKASDGYNG